MYKSKRYNVLVICLLFIISIVVGFSAGMASNSMGGNKGGLIDNEIPDGMEVIEDDETVIPIPDGLQMPGADASAFDRIAFALDIYENGAGFTSYVSQTLEAMGQHQQMAFKKYRGGGLDLSEEWFKMNGMLSGIGKNEFRSYFSNGTNMKFKTITNGANYNFDAKTYKYSAQDKLQEFTVDYYTNVQNRSAVNDFFTTINASTSSIEKYDKRTDEKNYVIRISINPKKLDARYLTTFTANGGDNVDIKSVVITLNISKTTGFLTSFSKVETFGATYVGYEAICQTTLKETYLTMNRSAETTIKEIATKSFGIAF